MGQTSTFLPFTLQDWWRTLIRKLKAPSSLEIWPIIYQSSRSHFAEHLNLPVIFFSETPVFYIVSTRMIDPKMSMQLLTLKTFNIFTNFMFLPHWRLKKIYPSQ